MRQRTVTVGRWYIETSAEPSNPRENNPQSTHCGLAAAFQLIYYSCCSISAGCNNAVIMNNLTLDFAY